VYSLGILELKKEFQCYNPSKKYLVSADVTFFEHVLYFSTQVLLIISEIVSPSLIMPLPTPVSSVSLSIRPAETKNSPASKSVRDFRYIYTHHQKVPISKHILAIPSPVDGPTPPPSASLPDIDVPIALQKGKWSCTDHPISNFASYDNLNPTFRQFVLSVF